MKKFALLVGVEDYRDKMISRLNFARADATTLAERLRDGCGFDQVRVLADESGEDEPLLVNIVTALRDTAVELRHEDLFLFFFAGHGLEKDGHGYLLARDSLQAFPEHGSLSLELLRKTLSHFSAGKRILLLDACRNSPEAGRGDAANCMGDVISRDLVAAARSKITGGTTTALLSACRSGQRAYEWPAKGHGVFTQYLVEGIDGAAWHGEQLEFDRLAGYASSQVCEWAANTPGLSQPQEPWYEKFGVPDAILLAAGECCRTYATPPSKPSSAPSQPQEVTADPTARWWIAVNEQEMGPLDEADVQSGIRDGSISPTSDCWREGMDRWQPIGQMSDWSAAFRVERPLTTPPKRKPTIHLPGFLDPVTNAQYAPLHGLSPGSEVAQKRQKEWVEKGYPLEVRLPAVDIVFRLVPPGKFLMRSRSGDTEAYDDERPPHRVSIARPIYVGRFPVTQRQWLAVMGANPSRFQEGAVLQEQHEKKSFWTGKETFGHEKVRLETVTKEHPVEQVSWDDCHGFLDGLQNLLEPGSRRTFRLLTEAEWEYACRAGTPASRYGDLDTIGWHDGNSGGTTHPVGRKCPNTWGLYDMIGNVWEWCEDLWHTDYKAAPTDGGVWEGADSYRVYRGGCWYDDAWSCRSASRSRCRPDNRFLDLGFRLALVPAEASGKLVK